MTNFDVLDGYQMRLAKKSGSLFIMVTTKNTQTRCAGNVMPEKRLYDLLIIITIKAAMGGFLSPDGVFQVLRQEILPRTDQILIL